MGVAFTGRGRRGGGRGGGDRVGFRKGTKTYSRAGHAIQDRHHGIKEREDQRIADHIPGDGAIPRRGLEGVAVENPRLGAVDDHAPKAQLAHDLIQRTLRHEELLRHVAEAVEGRSREGEEIALELVAGGDVAAVRARDVVARDQQARPADADQDPEHLRPVVADLQKEETDRDDDDDGPEVDELGGEDGGVAVGEHGEVVALDVAEGEDDVLPAVPEHHARPAAQPVAVEGVAGVDEVEQDVVEEGLEGRDGGPFHDEEGGQGVRAGDADSEDLAQDQDRPEVARLEVGELVGPGPAWCGFWCLGLLVWEDDLGGAVLDGVGFAVGRGVAGRLAHLLEAGVARHEGRVLVRLAHGCCCRMD